MKKMLLATVLFATVTTMNAQEKTAPAKPTKDPAVQEQRAAEKADKRTETLTKELGLSADQTAKVQVINDRFSRSMMDLHRTKLTEEAAKERGNVIRQDRDSELKAILTEEQYARMLAVRKEKKAEHKEKTAGDKKPHNE